MKPRWPGMICVQLQEQNDKRVVQQTRVMTKAIRSNKFDLEKEPVEGRWV